MKTKHIIYFPTWVNQTQINESIEESADEYAQLKKQITNSDDGSGASDILINHINNGTLDTRNVMQWLTTILDLYKQGKYSTYVFIQIRKITENYYSAIRKFFTKANTELTAKDIEYIKYVKLISQDEVVKLKKIDDTLEEMGFDRTPIEELYR